MASSDSNTVITANNIASAEFSCSIPSQPSICIGTGQCSAGKLYTLSERKKKKQNQNQNQTKNLQQVRQS